MKERYEARLLAYARYTGLATDPSIVVDVNALYAPYVIANVLHVGDMWLFHKWGIN